MSKQLSTYSATLMLLFLLFACTENHLPNPIPEQTLAAYLIEDTSFPLQRDSLIACAAGNDEFLQTDAQPVSIFFYPPSGAADFRYFETSSINADPEDFTAYQEVDLNDEPIFNGYLYRFLRPALDQNIWCRVSFQKGEKTWVSNAIRLKYNNRPTEVNDALVSIDQTEKLNPEFQWQDGEYDDNTIYFHVISDSTNNLLAGLYTFEKQLQFYNLSNVVLNIRDVNPPPVLVPNAKYQYLMMGVSEDNWVNLIIQKDFDTF